MGPVGMTLCSPWWTCRECLTEVIILYSMFSFYNCFFKDFWRVWGSSFEQPLVWTILEVHRSAAVYWSSSLVICLINTSFKIFHNITINYTFQNAYKYLMINTEAEPGQAISESHWEMLCLVEEQSRRRQLNRNTELSNVFIVQMSSDKHKKLPDVSANFSELSAQRRGDNTENIKIW